MEIKWYQQPWVTIALLVLFFPAGLYLMWRYAAWDQRIKWGLTSIFALLVVVAAIAGAVGGDDESDSDRVVADEPTRAATSPTPEPLPTEEPAEDPEAPSPEPTTEVIPPYRIVETRDISFGNTVRLVIKAVTDFPITKDEAQAIMDEIIEQTSSDTPLNALTVFLYDFEELADLTFTLAKADFAPDGEWRKADEVDAGDYDRHETVYRFQPKLDDPTAAMADRPSTNEVVLCAAFNKAEDENPDVYADLDIDDPDQVLAEIAAQEVDATAQEIVNAASKCSLWAFR